MKWQADGARDVYVCGDVPVGAVFTQIDARGRARWRLWLNGRDEPTEGVEADYVRAKRALENRFQHFLERAELRPTGFRRRQP
jgi:hypothetical protein